MASATKSKNVETPLENALWIPYEQIRANPNNARVLFDEAELKELALTIADHGLLHPLVVRYAPSRYDATPYLLIDGERRWRASEGILDRVPCIVREVEEGKERQLSLIANLQRKDLTALEEAKGIRDLIESENLSARSAARDLGRSMGWVSKRLDLLKCGEDVQAVAARNPLVMSSLLLIDGVKDKSTRKDLLAQVESGASHSVIKSQVENYHERERESKAQAKQSTHAPDTQTHQRMIAFESNGTPNMSRGKRLTGNTPAEAKQVVTDAVQSIEWKLDTIEKWMDKVSAGNRKTLTPRLARLQKRIGDLL